MKYQELDNGSLLPLAESFYSIQGEGFNTGKAAFFIRLGGCDVGCSWCDAKETWNPGLYPPTRVEKIVEEAVKFNAKSIVITGGEPLTYPLDKLTSLLRSEGMKIFLETSGTHPLSGEFDWICLSPKRKKRPLTDIYSKASEIKIIIECEDDFLWAEECREMVFPETLLYLQPEWSKRVLMMPLIVEYVKENPVWNISLQTHKYMNIP